MNKLIALFLLAFNLGTSFAQKIVADCSVVFAISLEKTTATSNTNATKTLYIKGKQVRIDINSNSYNQSVIYDNVSGTAVILKEVGANKYMSTLNAEQWKEKNKRYEGLQIIPEAETKTILGYQCKKAIAKLVDGTTFSFYYTPVIIPSASENPYQFKDVPGFVLEYESESENGLKKITYAATKINLSPVPASKFEIPIKGYRVL